MICNIFFLNYLFFFLNFATQYTTKKTSAINGEHFKHQTFKNMKTKIALLIVLLAFIGNNANAQVLNLNNNKDRLTIGFQLGEVGWNTTYHGFGWGVGVSLFGVYLDCLISGPQHKFDKHVNSTKWDDDAEFAINAGYQIPITSWLRVAPIVGYCQTSYGKTDASTVNVEVTDHHGRIYHDYHATERFHYFNYGGGIFIQPFRHVEFYAVGTVRAIYGGISLNLSNMADSK